MRNVVFVLTGVAFVAVLSLRIGLIFTWHYDLGGVEQDEIYTLQRVLAGYPVYENPADPPFAITQKTPLYHYLCFAVGTTFGVDPDSPFQVYLLNRYVSLALCLLTLFLAFYLQRRWLSIPVKEALLACMLMFLCFEEHAFNRPDSLYTFLFLATISTGVAAIQTQKKNLWVWAVVLSAMAIFAKQSGILLPALLFAYLTLWRRNWMQAFQCALAFALAFGVFLWLLKGESLLVFKANVANGLDNGIDFGWAFDSIYNKSYKKFAILFVIGVFIAGEWLLRKSTPELMRFLGLCLAGTFLFAHLTGLKQGSAPSYFTEFNMLTLISVLYYWRESLLPEEIEKFGDRIRFLAWGFTLAMIPLQTSDKYLFSPYRLQDKSVFERSEQLRRHLNLNPGDYVLSDHPVPTLYLFRNALLPQNDISTSLMATKTNFYDQLPIMLETGKISYFITQAERIEEQVILGGSINFSPYFRYDHSYAGFHIYVPSR